jgi:anti-sigma B factor antagonist
MRFVQLSAMTIRERSRGDVVVLDVEGSLSATDSARPLRALVEALVREHRSRIILNMERVPYLDSTGLADVVEAFHATRRAGGALKLVHLTRRVRELLTLTTLLSVLEVFDAEADAVASFGPTASSEECRIVIDGVNDAVVVAQLERAIRAALSDVDVRGAWTLRVAPASSHTGEWILTIDNPQGHDKTSLASERDALHGAAEHVLRAFPSLMAALNAATTIT